MEPLKHWYICQTSLTLASTPYFDIPALEPDYLKYHTNPNMKVEAIVG